MTPVARLLHVCCGDSGKCVVCGFCFPPPFLGASAQVAFIVQAGERNVVDQRFIEFGLLSDHGIRSTRVTLGEVFGVGGDGLDTDVLG